MPQKVKLSMKIKINKNIKIIKFLIFKTHMKLSNNIRILKKIIFLHALNKVKEDKKITQFR